MGSRSAEIKAALTYRDSALRASALPLGGIGTGTVALAGDGGLRQWQISNNVNHDAHVPHSFFALWAGGWQVGQGSVVLQSDALYDDGDFEPAPSVSDHLVPEGSRRLLTELPGVDRLAITARYPIVDVDYDTPSLPVEVKLEAFSPFVPLNEKDSGLPAVVFNFTVTNPNDSPVKASLLVAQQNLVGWDGKTEIGGVEDQGYGGNVNNLTHLRGVTALDMGNAHLAADDPANGRLAVAVLREPDDELTAMLQWQAPGQVWTHFSRRFGRLPERADVPSSSEVSPEGQTWNGALSVSFDLAPGASRTVPIVLAWYFSNRPVTWNQQNMGVCDCKSRFHIGNQYNNWFDSALAVVEYVRDHCERLCDETRLFRDSFFDGSLPWELLESVAGPVSTIRTPTCLWNEDGRFHGFEGCHGASTTHGALEGCCPMDCTHVWNYEMALAKLFPHLEQGMRRTDLVDQMSPRGEIPHRTPLPLYLPRPWDEVIGGPRSPAMDGELGTVLKTWREVRQGAGPEWFDEMWPRVKRLMAHVMEDYDRAGDGVIRGEQPNTYDISIYGPNTFIGSLYMAALRAAEEMARRQGEDDLADSYHERFELGYTNYDAICYNGEYYIQIVDLDEHSEQQFGTGCHIDQLLGQWWALTLDLGHVFPPEHVAQAACSIFNNNRREGFRREDQRPRVFMDERDRGLYICSWPAGGKPDVPTQYSDEVWSGLEYPIACLLLYEGCVDEALTVLREGARARYDGTRRSPWNEVECGDHYVRPMASWSLLEAAAGYAFDATTNTLSFSPIVSPDRFQSFFITGSGWGVLRRAEIDGRVSVEVATAWGVVSLDALRLGPQGPKAPSVTLDGQALPMRRAIIEDQETILLNETATIEAGETLTVAFDRS